RRRARAVRRVAARLRTALERAGPRHHHSRPRMRPHYSLDRPLPRVRSPVGVRPQNKTRRAARPALDIVRPGPDGRRKFRMSPRERNQFLTSDRMRTPVMAGNWKMYKTAAESTLFFEKFRTLVYHSGDCEILVCLPFANL